MLEGKRSGGNSIQLGPKFAGVKFDESAPNRELPPPSLFKRAEVYSADPLPGTFSLRSFFS
jgi:hypothetical protein